MKKVILIVIIFSRFVFAGHPLVTDDVGTVGKKVIQMEITPEWYKSTHENDLNMPLVFTVGVFESLDLVAGMPYCFSECQYQSGWENINGFIDPSLELKWRFYRNDYVGVAVKSGFTIPFGDGSDERTSSYSGLILLSWEGENVLIHNNFGLIYSEDNSTNQWNWVVSAGLELPVGKKLNVVMDLVAERNTEPGNKIHPIYTVQGLQYMFNDNLVLDAGFKTGLNKAERAFVPMLGMTTTF
ncbi:MAG: transporter [Calditrichia bacterium]